MDTRAPHEETHSMTKSKTSPGQIVRNKRASFEYFLEQEFEAGLSLLGWEVKSLREKKVHFDESYVMIKDGEAYLFGTHITPLNTVSTHITPDPTRNRKLLLNKKEISRILGGIQRQGYTCVPVKLYWKNNRVKCLIALAKGKQKFDKRATAKERDWNREKQRTLKSGLK